MKLFLPLLLLVGLLSCVQPQQKGMNVVHIEFEGIRYDSLALVLWFEEDFLEQIKGHSEDGYRWEFTYPDSLHERIKHSVLRVLGTPDSVEHGASTFNLVLQDDTLRSFAFIPGRPESFIRARHIETQTYINQVIFSITEMDFAIGTLIVDEFEIFTENQDVISSIKAVSGGYIFSLCGLDPLIYEETVQRQAEFIRQHPNSQIMIGSLYMNMGDYKSKDDVAKLFNNFSPELQQSFYGRKIYRFITPNQVFANQKLSTWDTDKLEKIVQDSSRYNLVIFSVSWCGPCIRQIPIQKEIYRDLGQKLIMTYVSLDDERFVEYWRERMREHEIPWRSLMVLTREKERKIRGDYYIRGFPTALLVHPNTMIMERLNLWEEADRQRLYELVK